MKNFNLFLFAFIFYFSNYSVFAFNGFTNYEHQQILHSFDKRLNIKESCVICRYVTQKIYKHIHITKKCSDIITKFVIPSNNQALNENKQFINKWTILYNLQKDYKNRILKKANKMLNYDQKLHIHKLRKHIANENKANLIQFINKVNKDLKKKPENCEKQESSQEFSEKHRSMINSINKGSNIRFKEIGANTSNLKSHTRKYSSLKTKKGQILDSKSAASKIDLSKMIENIQLDDDEQILYLGSQVGNNINSRGSNRILNKLNKLNHETSFIETSSHSNLRSSSYNEFFRKLVLKSKNFNLVTQRRQRRLGKLPDMQWDCAESQITAMIKYLCEKEIPNSYEMYCKPIFKQINSIIEGYLYHDNSLRICQNISMCSVTN